MEKQRSIINKELLNSMVVNSEEEYNPEIHCCDKWYKDYCQCSKEYVKELRNKNVNSTVDFLKDNNIEFVKSKVSNVVIVNPNTDNVHLSLKRTTKGLFKCRFKGSNKWYYFNENKFLIKFSK